MSNRTNGEATPVLRVNDGERRRIANRVDSVCIVGCCLSTYPLSSYTSCNPSLMVRRSKHSLGRMVMEPGHGVLWVNFSDAGNSCKCILAAFLPCFLKKYLEWAFIAPLFTPSYRPLLTPSLLMLFWFPFGLRSPYFLVWVSDGWRGTSNA